VYRVLQKWVGYVESDEHLVGARGLACHQERHTRTLTTMELYTMLYDEHQVVSVSNYLSSGAGYPG